MTQRLMLALTDIPDDCWFQQWLDMNGQPKRVSIVCGGQKYYIFVKKFGTREYFYMSRKLNGAIKSAYVGKEMSLNNIRRAITKLLNLSLEKCNT